MRKATNFFVILLALSFVACGSEDSLMEESVSLELNVSTAEYLKFVEDLQTEFVGKVIYHDFNRPDFSQEIKQLKSSLKEDELSYSLKLGNLSTINGANFGPYGGNGGSAFDARLSVYPEEKWKRLRAIKIRSAGYIDAIQLYWTNDRNITSSSPHYGGMGGSESWLYLADGEYITGVRVIYNEYVDNLTFITNYNVYTFGGSGGRHPIVSNLNFGITGLQLHGIYGRSGSYVDQLGFHCYPSNLFP